VTPFVSGGTELAVRALQRELSARGYPVDVVRIPFTWKKEELLDNAFLWRLVNVDADICIATNFPSYFVRHDAKVVWLFHQHRTLYDLYDTPFSDWGKETADGEVRQAIMTADTHFLGEAGRLFATSRNVADRLRRWNGLAAEPLYHPPPLHARLGCREYGDFILMPTRLEPHKRPGLLIDALARTGSDIRAVIAGRGPLESELRAAVDRHGLAGRVRVAGYVEDDVLADLYATCAAVFYAPFDEDYGYASLEAFCARKPVVTATDAGGVLEFVDDGATGVVAAPDADSLAQAIDRLAESRALCRRLGEAGFERVRHISWDDVIARLIGA